MVLVVLFHGFFVCVHAKKGQAIAMSASQKKATEMACNIIAWAINIQHAHKLPMFILDAISWKMASITYTI